MKVSTRLAGNLRAIPTQIAVRYRKGQERKVVTALSVLGTLEHPRPRRTLILHRSEHVSQREVDALLTWLQERGAIDFATAMLRDVESGQRQVLTNEIVVRLKPGAPPRETLATLKAEYGVSVCKQNDYEPTQYIVKVTDPSGTNTLDVAESLCRNPQVEFASPNFLPELER